VRHLIVCCDGTWQTNLNNSNVVRLRDALAKKTSTGIEQKCCYIKGVGTGWNPGNRLAGGVAGVGLSANIMQAYKWLAEQYQAGDVVALFGFSRGAYTARSLAGMIGRCGLLDATNVKDVDAAVARVYRRYREGRQAPDDRRWRDDLSFHENDDSIPVHFIGVWDTVGSLGVPDHLTLLNLLDRAYYEFHDVRLDRRIPHARHAISLDENRGPFAPTLWHDPPPEQDVKQVWFPGDHGDVGGGHPNKGLSDGALLWMMDEAEAAIKIEFDQSVRKRYKQNPLAVQPWLRRSVERIAEPATDVAFRPWPRAVPRVDKSAPLARTAHPAPDVHPSAFKRQDAASLPGGPYRPTRTLAAGESATIAVPASDAWSATGLWLEPGKYEFTADGTWRSMGTQVGPGGSDQPRSPGHLLGSAIGRVEGRVRRVLGNEPAQIVGSWREPDLPWMSLVGYVANERRDAEGKIVHKHQRIPIGAGTTREIKQGGYLHAFANDAWGFYVNNSGAVQLTVSMQNSH